MIRAEIEMRWRYFRKKVEELWLKIQTWQTNGVFFHRTKKSKISKVKLKDIYEGIVTNPNSGLDISSFFFFLFFVLSFYVFLIQLFFLHSFLFIYKNQTLSIFIFLSTSIVASNDSLSFISHWIRALKLSLMAATNAPIFASSFQTSLPIRTQRRGESCPQSTRTLGDFILFPI